MPYDHCFKYTIIGDPGVGKTCLRLQFRDRTFQPAYEATSDIEFGTRTIVVDDKPIRLEIWNTAGKGVSGHIIKQYYSRVACIILVYDITRRVTFNRIVVWLEKARTLSRADVTLLLIGNKCDLSNMHAVGYEEGQKFAEKHNLLLSRPLQKPHKTLMRRRRVGKTCLSLQFMDRTFQTAYEDTGDNEFGTRTIAVDDKPIHTA